MDYLGKTMKVLLVAMTNSVHTGRWVEQILDMDDCHIKLYPSTPALSVHDKLKSDKISLSSNLRLIHQFNFRYGPYLYSLIIFFKNLIGKKIFKRPAERGLFKEILQFKPDIIHSLETQHAGYLVDQTLSYYGHRLKKMPVWWHTNWGSDIYLFGRLVQHRDKIRGLLQRVDLYSCECSRDKNLAREFGFDKEILPVYPNTGGFKMEMLQKLNTGTSKTSERKIIVLKGYQGWAGRALFGLRALWNIKGSLNNFELAIFSNTGADDIKIAAELFQNETGIKVTLIPEHSSHQTIMQLFCKARIYIGLSISDGISTSMLEAMSVGTFPIQSITSGAGDWIENGKNGFLVEPEDIEVISKQIERALKDDALVEDAAKQNAMIIKEKADFEKLRQLTKSSYVKAYNLSKIKNNTV